VAAVPFRSFTQALTIAPVARPRFHHYGVKAMAYLAFVLLWARMVFFVVWMTEPSPSAASIIDCRYPLLFDRHGGIVGWITAAVSFCWITIGDVSLDHCGGIILLDVKNGIFLFICDGFNLLDYRSGIFLLDHDGGFHLLVRCVDICRNAVA
jgi:hypothetical protein